METEKCQSTNVNPFQGTSSLVTDSKSELIFKPFLKLWHSVLESCYHVRPAADKKPWSQSCCAVLRHLPLTFPFRRLRELRSQDSCNQTTKLLLTHLHPYLCSRIYASNLVRLKTPAHNTWLTFFFIRLSLFLLIYVVWRVGVQLISKHVCAGPSRESPNLIRQFLSEVPLVTLSNKLSGFTHLTHTTEINSPTPKPLPGVILWQILPWTVLIR